MALHQLDNALIERVRSGRANRIGRYSDGGGLYLKVGKVGPIGSRAKNGSKGSASWVFRFERNGQRTYLGGGSLADVGLSAARDWASEQRAILARGGDPRGEREQEAARIQAARDATVTFKQEAERLLAARDPATGNAKHNKQWRSTLETYAYPEIGALAVATLTRRDVLDVLEPIWATKNETARRVRQRIEAVIDAAIARGVRTDGNNPARWLGLRAVLGTRRPAVKHHAAVPVDDLPAVFKKLGKSRGVAAAATAFTILCAARPGEVTGAQWPEIDRDGACWQLPPDKQKSGKPHRVPLSPQAVAILDRMAKQRLPDNPHVFPGHRRGKPLSLAALSKALAQAGGGDATVHGTARSTFDDWAHERASFPPALVDRALAHGEKSKAIAAYRRSDLYAQRRPLMAAWGTFCRG